MGRPKDVELDVESAADALEEFLELVLDGTRLELEYELEVCDPEDPVDVEAPDIVVDFAGRDTGLLLEERAELLRAVEYLAHRWIGLDPAEAARVRVDCNNHRADRVAELTLAARMAAEQVRKTSRPFRFQPMNARERRVVHLALRDEAGLSSASEGEGEFRAVIVQPS